MDRFATYGTAAVGSDTQIICIYNAQATPKRRAAIYDVVVGCKAAPADAATSFMIQRSNSAPTGGTAFTPVALNPGALAAESTSAYAGTGGAGRVASGYCLQFSLNQRGTFRWVAAPGSEIIAVATQNYGLLLKSDASTVATAHEACILFGE